MLKKLKFKKGQEWDKLINGMRCELGLPVNRALFMRLATEAYVMESWEHGKFMPRYMLEHFRLQCERIRMRRSLYKKRKRLERMRTRASALEREVNGSRKL